MAIGIYFDGRRLIRPQAVTKIDDTGMYGRGLGGANVLAVIGEATGGEPKKVMWFTDPTYAKTILKSGNLLKAIQRAYDPSSQVAGAYTVAAMRVNPAQQAELVLTDSVYNPLILVKSVDYGVWNNQIKVRIEDGTLYGKKLTVTYGDSYDSGDNVRRQSIYLGYSDPLARSGTYYVEIPVQGGYTTKRLRTEVSSWFQRVHGYDSVSMTNMTAVAREVGTLFFLNGTGINLGIGSTNCYMWVGSDQPFGQIDFNLGSGTPNDVVATLSVEYWDGSFWEPVDTLDTLDIQNPPGTPFGKTGSITFDIPSNWVKTTFESADLYWIRVGCATGGPLNVLTQGDYLSLTRGLTVNLANYPTIQDLAFFIDSQPNYECGMITSKGSSEYSFNLDDTPTTGKPLLGGSLGETTLDEDYDPITSGAHLHVAATTNFNIGDYITISSVDGVYQESRRITSMVAGVSIGIDSALSTTYSGTGGTAAVVRAVPILNSDLQAIIEWFGENSAYVTASYIDEEEWEASTVYAYGHAVVPTSANGFAYIATVGGTSDATEPVWPVILGGLQTDGSVTWRCVRLTRGAYNVPDTSPIANVSDTYLNGGSEGTTTQSDWDACLETLQNEDTNLITCVSTDPAVWASLSTHCEYMSSTGKRERIGFCGGFSETDGYTNGLGKWNNTTNILNSIDAMLAYALGLNTDRMVYVGPGFSAYDENGTLTTYNGAISAALVAGMAAGVDVAEPLTHKQIKVIGLEYNFKWADLDRLLEGGVCPLEYDPGRGYRVCQSITTWLRNDKYNRREVSVRRTADYVARQVRDRLEQDFVGTKGTLTTLISIKNATISVLTQMVRLQLLAGDATNPPFKNVQCRLEGDTCYVDFECSPVIPINYIPVTIHLTVFTTTLTA